MFSDRTLRALKPKASRFTTFEDSPYGHGRLGVRVSPNGVKTFIFRHSHAGKERLRTMGKYPELGLAEARKMAADYAERLGRGESLETATDQQASTPAIFTFQQLGEEFIEKEAKPNKASWKGDAQKLKSQIYPVFGEKPAKEIMRTEIRDFLETKAITAPIRANRLRALIHRIYNWGLERDLVEFNPCAGVKPPGKESSRERCLTDTEVRQLWSWCNTKLDFPFGPIIRLLLLTGQRSGEVRQMRWDEVDGPWWTIPKDKTKHKKRDHRVFLGPTAVKTIELCRQISGDTPWIMPSPKTKFKTPIHPTSLSHAIERLQIAAGLDDEYRYIPHDIRRTFATGLGGLQVGEKMISRILSHTLTGVTDIYDRYRYDGAKRRIMIAWDHQIVRILSGEDVSNYYGIKAGLHQDDLAEPEDLVIIKMD